MTNINNRSEFRINNFDLIRLIAALQVMLVHGFEHFEIESSIIDALHLFPGVPIFFVISGFLISRSWENSTSLKSYARNRFLRIYPALWCCFIISFISVFFLHPLNASFIDIGKWVLSQITFIQFYNPDFLRSYGTGVLNGSLWTIPVEIQFYIMLPLAYIIFKKNHTYIYIAILLFIVFNRIYFDLKTYDNSIYTKLFGVSLIPYLYIFLIGVLIQKNFNIILSFIQNRAALWLLIYLASALISYGFDFNYNGSSMNPIQTIFLAIFIISFAYSYSSTLSNILKGFDISYGVYIYHMVILNIVLHSSTLTPQINMTIMSLITIIAALLSWVLIEKPSLNLKKTPAKT